MASLLAVALLLAGALLPQQVTAAPAAPSILSGSHYHPKFEGRPTACGGRYDASALTAASTRHPCHARVRVTYGSRSVVVRITDRCSRCGIDLSHAAAREIGLLRVGRSKVQVERLE